MLKAINIKKSYGGVPVLKGIDIEVQKGEVVTIVGASGAGKSTLLQILGTLDKPDDGEVLLNGQNVSSMEGDELAKIRNLEMGFVFQFHNLLPEFTALENICMPGMIKGLTLDELKPKALELMEMLNISHRQDHKPAEMSGGEQQRTAVARALINDPSIIFADEPSGNLDSHNADSLHKLFFQLREDLNQTFVIVTHNKEFASMADRILEIADGQIYQEVKKQV
ncbi:ABC transporter ATP-binding protein [Limibacter armeniacum]|uniref:ABC transporter ATP-binding protein n=1 Tax=Limibacter armeniacum TaxID=466084 RepID=UPI002FE5EF8C